MYLSCRGWKKNHGINTLLAKDISKVKPRQPEQFEYLDEAYIDIEDNSVKIRAAATRGRLTGDFQFCISLTKAEIANLAAIAFETKPFGKVIRLFSKASRATMSDTRRG